MVSGYHVNGTVEFRNLDDSVASLATTTACDNCHGTGDFENRRCDRCGGKGSLDTRNRLQVRIPAGVCRDSLILLRRDDVFAGRETQSQNVYLRVKIRPCW